MPPRWGAPFTSKRAPTSRYAWLPTLPAVRSSWSTAGAGAGRCAGTALIAPAPDIVTVTMLGSVTAGAVCSLASAISGIPDHVCSTGASGTRTLPDIVTGCNQVPSSAVACGACLSFTLPKRRAAVPWRATVSLETLACRTSQFATLHHSLCRLAVFRPLLSPTKEREQWLENST